MTGAVTGDPAGGRPAALDLPWLHTPLRQALHDLRGHALLVCAPPGAGAFELALAVAQGWLCQSPADGLPCGHCASCHWVASRSHPDLLCLLPEALQELLGWRAGESAEADTRVSPPGTTWRRRPQRM